MKEVTKDLLFASAGEVAFVVSIIEGSVVGTAVQRPDRRSLTIYALHGWRDDAYRKAGWLRGTAADFDVLRSIRP